MFLLDQSTVYQSWPLKYWPLKFRIDWT